MVASRNKQNLNTIQFESMADQDYLYALRLQQELDDLENHGSSSVDNNKRKRDETDLNATQNIVNPQWEEIDPTPDIHSLFGAFDLKFFRGKLKCVELEWSKKMYRCAGICYQRRNAIGMSITIRLSEPLLKLRTRRNLIETLLHEMIHAFLFVSNIREPNGGHGPNFKKMMTDINKVAGTNITVYHTFHEEVAAYQTHIWRCNGICQHRKPFYGWVKRTRNLAPSHRDLWFAKHQETCGGTFQKVSEPEPKAKPKKAKVSHAVENVSKITDFWNPKDTPPNKSNTPRNPLSGYMKMNGGGTIVMKPTTQNRDSPIIIDDDNSKRLISDAARRSAAGGNLSNVIGFRDLNSSGSGNSIKSPLPTGNGKMLGSSGYQNTQQSNKRGNPSEHIRSVWANRFNNPALKTNDTVSSAVQVDLKTRVNVTEASSNWEEIDDDILIRSVQDAIVEIGDDSDTETDVKPIPQMIDTENASVLQKSIKEELLDDLGENSDAIEMIDDEFDENLNTSLEILADAEVLSDIFGMDDLLDNFNEINNVVMKFPENKGNPNKEIISCPICQDSLPRDELSEHLDGCTGITVKIEKLKRNVGKTETLPFYKNKAKPSTSTSTSANIDNSAKKDMLRRAGYDQETIDRLFTETQEAKKYNKRIMREICDEQKERSNNHQSDAVETIALIADDDELIPQNDAMREKATCPVCNILVYSDLINQHLDDCLNGC